MKYLLTAIFLLGSVAMSHAQSPSPFRLETVMGAFDQMRSTPGFDTSKPLRWGFFFVSPSQESLIGVRKKLGAQDYRYVDEFRGDDGSYWLHLDKTEVHTPQSLHMRNQELFAFAKKFPGVDYDGWDVARSEESE